MTAGGQGVLRAEIGSPNLARLVARRLAHRVRRCRSGRAGLDLYVMNADGSKSSGSRTCPATNSRPPGRRTANSCSRSTTEPYRLPRGARDRRTGGSRRGAVRTDQRECRPPALVPGRGGIGFTLFTEDPGVPHRGRWQRGRGASSDGHPTADASCCTRTRRDHGPARWIGRAVFMEDPPEDGRLVVDWSPDGAWIVASAPPPLASASGPTQVYLIRADGTETFWVGPGAEPSWPGGRMNDEITVPSSPPVSRPRTRSRSRSSARAPQPRDAPRGTPTRPHAPGDALPADPLRRARGRRVDVVALDRRPGSGTRSSLSMADLRSRPRVTLPITLECAGNGRARLAAADLAAVAHRGDRHRRVDRNAAPSVARGGRDRGRGRRTRVAAADRGIQGEVEHDYERSLTVADAMRDEVLLAYEMNGAPLPPQHGFRSGCSSRAGTAWRA